jgi:hypothetical protein
VTPCVVQAKRNADITVTVNKEGYEPQVIPSPRKFPHRRGRFRRQSSVGGVVGMGVDAVTGAALDHKPNPVIVTLQPVAPAQPGLPSRARRSGRRHRRARRRVRNLTRKRLFRWENARQPANRGLKSRAMSAFVT